MSEDIGAIEIAACYFLSQEYLMTRFSGEVFDGENMVDAFVAGAQFAMGEERKAKRTGNVIFIDQHRKEALCNTTRGRLRRLFSWQLSRLALESWSVFIWKVRKLSR